MDYSPDMDIVIYLSGCKFNFKIVIFYGKYW